MFHARSQCRQQHSLICRFDPRAVDEWFDGELRWTDGRLRGGLNIVSRRIRMVLSGIAEELRQPGFASNAMVDLMAAQAAIELSRHMLGLGDGVDVGGLGVWPVSRRATRLAGDPIRPPLHHLAHILGVDSK